MFEPYSLQINTGLCMLINPYTYTYFCIIKMKLVLKKINMTKNK